MDNLAEAPIVFQAAQRELFGILTLPQATNWDVGVVLLTGGGHSPGFYRNRIWVRLARRLASEGFAVLRFDYHGVGESIGTLNEYWLDRPFIDDLIAAVECAERCGARRIALVGSCFGARTILASMDRIPRLSAAVLLSIPLRGHRAGEYAATRFASQFTTLDYIRRSLRLRVVRRMLDPRWRAAYVRIIRVKIRSLLRIEVVQRNGNIGVEWVSPRFLASLRQAVDVGAPLLFLYGERDEYYEEFRQALAGELGRIVGSAGDTVQVSTISGVLHGLTTLESQDLAVERTVAWLCATHGMEAPATPHQPTFVGTPVEKAR